MCPKSAGSRKRRQLTYDDRLQIERGVNKWDRLSTIARTLGRSPKVVASEIKRNWTDDPRGMLSVQTRNLCVHVSSCTHVDLCKRGCLQRCSRCKKWLCNEVCPDFEAEMCPRLTTAPYCCNNCPERMGYGCSHPYRFYEAKYAHDLAQRRRSESRAGIDCTQEEFDRAVETIKKRLKKGQSPANIISTSDDIPFSVSTFYRLLGGGGIKSLTKLDLPRAVRYKPRKKKPSASAIPRALLKGRTYDDYKGLDEALKAATVEMDTVVGRLGVDRQAILTLYFRRFHFQLFILLSSNTEKEVVKALDRVDELCGEMFPRLFPILLCDRGGEFSDVLRMENRKNGRPRTRVFFCDPLQSQQKGGAEKNHEELRKILPKGETDFDALTGRDMAVCMSHVNSYCRESIDWWSPISLASVVMPHGLLDGLGIERVEPGEVNLTPYLVPHAIAKK